MKVLAILFNMTAFTKKGMNKMDTLEDFPRNLRLHRKGVPCCWWWTLYTDHNFGHIRTQRSKSVSSGGEKKGTREGGERKECQPASSLTSLSTSCYLCASSVSKQGFQREYECVCTWTFFSAQLINVRRMSGSERITHFSLTPLGKFRDPGGCPGFIYHIHPPLMGSLSQLMCG